jgi:hypothetical protein
VPILSRSCNISSAFTRNAKKKASIMAQFHVHIYEFDLNSMSCVQIMQATSATSTIGNTWYPQL